MYCKRCGSENSENNKYCWKCGQPLGSSNGKKTARKQKHILLAVGIAALVLALVFGITEFAMQTLKENREKKVNNLIVDAGKYLEALDYTQAEDCYLEAIEIDEKREQPYLELAVLYQEQDQMEKALDILKLGMENTESSEIQGKYDLYTYVEEVLIPEEGKCDLGPFECDYYLQENGAVERRQIQDASGIITSKIQDFDQDGQEELLVVVLDNQVEDEIQQEIINGIQIRMYEVQQGEIVLSSECLMMEDVLGGGDTEDDWMFLKTVDNKTYICSSTNQLTCLIADGLGVSLNIVSYRGQGTGFVTETAGSAMGSDFYGIDNSTIISALERIGGFEVTLQNIYETSQRYIPAEETYDEILFSIYGKNENADFESETAQEARRKFYETRDPSWLGSMKVQIYVGQRSDLSQTQTEEVEADHQETAVDETSAEETKSTSAVSEISPRDTDEYYQKLQSLEQKEEDLYGQTTDSQSMKDAVAQVYEWWDDELNYVYQQLKQTLSDEEFQTLKEEELDWIAARDSEAEKVAEQWEGGSDQIIAVTEREIELTKERTYELTQRWKGF